MNVADCSREAAAAALPGGPSAGCYRSVSPHAAHQSSAAHIILSQYITHVHALCYWLCLSVYGVSLFSAACLQISMILTIAMCTCTFTSCAQSDVQADVLLRFLGDESPKTC